MFDPTAALIDQTTICEAGRLLSGAPVGKAYCDTLTHLGSGASDVSWGVSLLPPSHSERLLHLSLLLDALLLYDRVLLLRGEVPPDATGLPLRKYLLATGIAADLDAATVRDAVTADLRDLFPNQDVVVRASQRFLSADGAQRAPSAKPDRAEQLTAILAQCHEGNTFRPTLLPAEVIADPIGGIAREISRQAEYHASGSLVAGASHLRSLVYWRLSEHLQLPFAPSCRRLPHYELLRAIPYRGVRDQIYGEVAAAFQSEVSEVVEDARGVPLALPPSLTVFLEELIRCGDPIVALEELRTKYAPLRQALAEAARSLAAERLGERRKAKLRIARVMEVLPGGGQEPTVFDEALGYLPHLLKVIEKPHSPESYSEGLLKKPVEWIRKWWTRRPFRLLVDMRKRLDDLPRHEVLLKKALGIELPAAERDTFVSFYRRVLSKYQPGPEAKPGAAVAPTNERGA